MRFAFLSLLFIISTLNAEFVRQPIDQQLVDSKIKIIDIRTPEEWKKTGLVKGSIPIMFFDEQRHYDLEAFIAQLKKVVKKDEQFVIICRTGNRARIAGNLLGNQHGYNVIAIQGGIRSAIDQKITLEPYQEK
jgi:rhodanese-related sulfurtransferase